MKSIKSIIQFLLIFTMMFAMIEPSFADLYVEISPSTAHVGDIVTITVTASNDNLVDWYPVVIYAPIPDGLRYLSHVVPDKTQQNYDFETGIWNVNRMRHDERGHLKTLIITTRVLPEAAGKSIHAEAKFVTLVIEPTGRDITSLQPAARTDSLRIFAINNNNTDDGKGNGTGNGTGSGNGAGSGTGNGEDKTLINNAGNTQFSKLMCNNSQDRENNPLINSRDGGGGTGRAYEMINTTNQNNAPFKDTSYAILAIMGVIAIIVYGYYKEMKT